MLCAKWLYCQLFRARKLYGGDRRPIFNHERQVAAGISIAGFEARFTEDRLPYLTEKVKDAALQISRKIGYT